MNLDTTLIPPHSIEAEQSVLGAILLEGSTALDRIEGEITESDFYRPEHRRIFAGCCKLANLGLPVDVFTVSEALEADWGYENGGGATYLSSLAQNVPGASNIRFYAQTVRSRSLKRRLLALAVEIQEDCNLPGAEVAEIIAKADSAMVQLLDTHQDDPAMLSDVMAETIDEMDDRVTGCRPSGLLTGIQDFDAITGGLEPGQLVIVAARPSVGKTAFALNVANHMAREGRTVAFFSLEMQRRELAQRLIAMRTGVPVSDIREHQAQATVKFVTQYVDRVRVVREKGETIIKEVPVYVPVQADAACTINRGFVRLHDAAAGELPESPRDADAVVAGIALSAVAGNGLFIINGGHRHSLDLFLRRNTFNGGNVDVHNRFYPGDTGFGGAKRQAGAGYSCMGPAQAPSCLLVLRGATGSYQGYA